MPYLKFYALEKQVFNKEHYQFFTDDHALKICRKVARHFKIQVNKISFRKMKKRYGWANWEKKTVTFMHGPSIHIICHELAHLWQHQHQGKTRHDKKLLAIIRRMLAYCESKGWWISESVVDQRMIERAPLCFADKELKGKEEK